MHSFRDNEERPWNITITVGAIKRVKKLVGVDLLLLDVAPATDPTGPPLGARLATDMSLVCDVLFALVEPQAEVLDPPVTDVMFGEGLGPEGYAEGHRALKEELIDFFQKAGRSELAKMLEAHGTLVRLAMEKVTDRIESVDLEALARRISGDSSTSSPPSPESKTSTPSPSEKSPGGPSTASEPAGTEPPT